MTNIRLLAASALSALALSMPSAGAQQGVSGSEIVVGTIQDLSGPVAQYGKHIRNAMQMYFDDLNESGGINGRKVRLVVEDNGYDPRKSMLAAQKLVQSDGAFAILGIWGTAPTLAAEPVLLENGVISFMPISASPMMYLPADVHKFGFFVPMETQMETVVPSLIREKGTQRPCVIYQDDDFGAEVVVGAERGFAEAGLSTVEKASFKRGATDFASQVARLKAANCDLVVMATIIRETVGVMTEAKKVGLDAVFLGTTGAYTNLVPQLGGDVVNDFYAVTVTAEPTLDTKPEVVAWVEKYTARFGESPIGHTAYAWQIANLFAHAAEAAGEDLTVESFNRAMKDAPLQTDMFDLQGCNITDEVRICNTAMRLSQIQNGKWTIVSDWIDRAQND